METDGLKGGKRHVRATRTARAQSHLVHNISPANEKSQVSHLRYLTFLTETEGLGLRSCFSQFAVLEWMLEQPTENKKVAVLDNSPG